VHAIGLKGGRLPEMGGEEIPLLGDSAERATRKRVKTTELHTRNSTDSTTPTSPRPNHAMPETTYASLNPTLLAAYHRSATNTNATGWWNSTFPCVRKVADRQSRSTNLPFDDLLQLGCLGLIKAIESFDPGEGVALSSYAVPYIRGGHAAPRCGPAPAPALLSLLRELHRRGQTLQQQCLAPAVAGPRRKALAAALGCQPERWQEACALHWHCSCAASMPRGPRGGILLAWSTCSKPADPPPLPPRQPG